jgi:hypothetical protein
MHIIPLSATSDGPRRPPTIFWARKIMYIEHLNFVILVTF